MKQDFGSDAIPGQEPPNLLIKSEGLTLLTFVTLSSSYNKILISPTFLDILNGTRQKYNISPGENGINPVTDELGTVETASTIAFSGYTGTDAAGDGFTGHGNMDDANIHIWYKPEEAVSYDFTGNLLEGVPIQLNKRWSASSGTCVDSNGILVIKVPMSVALGKQFKLTGFNPSMTSVDGQPSTFYVQPDETSPGASVLAMKPLWDNSNCVNNGDGTYTVSVPNNDATTAHQILFITLAVDNTKSISTSDIANYKVEIL